MMERGEYYLEKAVESFAGAESEFSNRRYNNCANRCYYSTFLGAVFALTQARIQPPGRRAQWSHAFVPAQFDGQLINRRKLYPTTLRGTLVDNYALRQTADYEDDVVSQTEASRALRRTRTFMQAITTQRG